MLALLAVAGAFMAPVAQQQQVRMQGSILDECEKLLDSAVKTSSARMESRIKEMTADIDASEQSANEEMMLGRLDKIEDMLSEISSKLK